MSQILYSVCDFFAPCAYVLSTAKALPVFEANCPAEPITARLPSSQAVTGLGDEHEAKIFTNLCSPYIYIYIYWAMMLVLKGVSYQMCELRHTFLICQKCAISIEIDEN